MTVKIYTPTIHEVTQAVYNLNATKHLMTWHEHLLAGTRPLTDALQMWNFDPEAPRNKESRLDDYVEANPLSHAPRPMMDDEKIEIEFRGIMEFDTPVSRQAANSMIERRIIPVNIVPQDNGIYYMVKTEEINGTKYSFFRPCHPTEKPEEGERLERYEKPLRLPPQAQLDEGVLTTLVTAYGIRTPLPEGSFEEPTVTQHGWGPVNYQFKF